MFYSMFCSPVHPVLHVCVFYVNLAYCVKFHVLFCILFRTAMPVYVHDYDYNYIYGNDYGQLSTQWINTKIEKSFSA